MAYQVSFDGIWAKIEWAEHHRKALDDYIISIQRDKTKRSTLRADLNTKTGYHVLKVVDVADLTFERERVALLVGDVVNNLRAALDHLVFQLAAHRMNGEHDASRTQFPIDHKKGVFTSRSKRKGSLSQVASKHRTMIEKYQPYKRARIEMTWSNPFIHPLALLQRLSNGDKHHILTTTVATLQSYQMLFYEMPPMTSDDMTRAGRGLDRTLEVGANIHRARITGMIDGSVPKRHIDVAGYAAPFICLEEMRPAALNLKWISTYVVRIIREFEETFYPEAVSGHRGAPEEYPPGTLVITLG